MKSREIAKIVSGELDGDGDIEINGVGSLEDSSYTDVAFIENEKYLSTLQNSKSNCILAPLSLKGKIKRKAVIYVNDPYFSLLNLIKHLTPQKETKPIIHPTCVLGENVKIGRDVFLGPYTVIKDEVEIGDKVVILGLTYIGDKTKIGDSTYIHSNVVIEKETLIGQRVILHSGVVVGSDGFGFLYNKHLGQHVKKPQIGRVCIEDDVEIGANTSIDRATFKMTKIGRGTKVDNLVHIGHNVSIGENCLILAQATLGGSVKIGREVVVSGQTTITDNVEIGDRVKIGGLSGVTKSLLSDNDYWGIPAIPLKEKKKQIALINQLGKKLKQFEARIKELEAEKFKNK